MPFISFARLIPLARNANTVSNRKAESRHLFLVLLLKEKLSVLHY